MTRPRKAGRRPLPAAERRSERIVLLYRPADRDAVYRAAGGASEAAAWAARVVLEAAAKANEEAP